MNMKVVAGDPFILWDKKTEYYYVYSTLEKVTNDGWTFSIHKSKDLKKFEFVCYALDTKESKYGGGLYWAPEVYYSENNKNYYMFYSCALKKNYNKEYFQKEVFDESFKIFVACAKSPEGPFHEIEDGMIDYRPFDPNYEDIDVENYNQKIEKKQNETLKKGMHIPLIDANVFFDKNGKIYLYCSRVCYKNIRYDEKIEKYVEESEIIAVELESDWFYSNKMCKPKIKEEYKNYYGINKDKYISILSYKDQPQDWENANVNDYLLYNGIRPNRRWCEGSFMIYDENKYYLFYSSNNYLEENYKIGVAYSKTPLGPFVKSITNPILIESNTFDICSFGHCSILNDILNKKTICFHGRTNSDGERILCIGKLKNDYSKIELTEVPDLKVNN